MSPPSGRTPFRRHVSWLAEMLNDPSNAAEVFNVPPLPPPFVIFAAITPKVSFQKVAHPFLEFARKSNAVTIGSGCNPEAAASDTTTHDSVSLTLVHLKMKQRALLNDCFYIFIHINSGERTMTPNTRTRRRGVKGLQYATGVSRIPASAGVSPLDFTGSSISESLGTLPCP